MNKENIGDETNGFNASINIGLDMTDIEVGASDSAGGPGGPGGGHSP